MTFNPIFSFIVTIKNLIIGYIDFPKTRIGEKLIINSGEEVTIFRQVIVGDKEQYLNKMGVIFHVKFHLKNMSPNINKTFSLIPIPFFVGLPGFRAKIWAFNDKNGEFHGFYEWESLAYAKKYSESFAIKFMTKRSLPNSVKHEIIELKKVNDEIRPINI